MKNEPNYILTPQLLQYQLQCDLLISRNNLYSTTCIEDKETHRNSRTSKSRKCVVPLQNLNRVGQHIQQPQQTVRQSDGQKPSSPGRSECEEKEVDRKTWGEFGEKGVTKKRCLAAICWNTWKLPLKIVSEQWAFSLWQVSAIVCLWNQGTRTHRESFLTVGRRSFNRNKDYCFICFFKLFGQIIHFWKHGFPY